MLCVSFSSACHNNDSAHNSDGVLFGYSPEVFPTPSRGTGDALAATANRMAGILSPIIAIYSEAARTPDGPVYTSAALLVVAGIVTLFFPIETRGRTAL